MKVDRADEDYFREDIAPLLTSPGVEFIGEIDDAQKQNFLSGAIALLVPIDWPEPFGLAMIEAMACGLCVVSTNVGGIPYLLEHELDAILVPPASSAAMAQAVHRILTDPALAEKLSRNARAKAALFDWAAILAQWEDLLLETATNA